MSTPEAERDVSSPYVGRAVEDVPQLWDGFAKLVRAGLRVLCVGSVPGGVYEPPEWTGEE